MKVQPIQQQNYKSYNCSQMNFKGGVIKHAFGSKLRGNTETSNFLTKIIKWINELAKQFFKNKKKYLELKNEILCDSKCERLTDGTISQYKINEPGERILFRTLFPNGQIVEIKDTNKKTGIFGGNYTVEEQVVYEPDGKAFDKRIESTQFGIKKIYENNKLKSAEYPEIKKTEIPFDTSYEIPFISGLYFDKNARKQKAFREIVGKYVDKFVKLESVIYGETGKMTPFFINVGLDGGIISFKVYNKKYILIETKEDSYDALEAAIKSLNIDKFIRNCSKKSNKNSH